MTTNREIIEQIFNEHPRQQAALIKALERALDTKDALLKERDATIEALKKDVEHYVWNLAGCTTMAEARSAPPFDEAAALPALKAVQKLVLDYMGLQASLAAEKERAEAKEKARTAMSEDLKLNVVENARLTSLVDRLIGVMHWTQAVLTAWNVGDLQRESPLHQKLREVMIEARKLLAERSKEGKIG